MNIPAWSFSSLSTFESCPRHIKLQKIDRIPELPKPTSNGEPANERGSRVHDGIEQYIRGNQPLPKEAQAFASEIDEIKRYFQQGQAEMEGMWTFDNAWRSIHPQDIRNIWLRVKLDAMVFLDDVTGLVIDFKTGKRWNNEVKHGQQCQLYQLAAFLRFPQLQLIHTELYYLDVDELSRMTFTRSQGLRFLKAFNERGMAMTTETEFPAKPSVHTCKFCPYNRVENSNRWVQMNGACPDGV